MKFKLILLLSLIGFSCALFAANENEAVQNKDKPVTTTTGFMQEINEVRVYDGPTRTGKQVFEFRCNGCHGRNTQGAPMPDDKFEWSLRLKKKGLATLLKHSMEGFSNTLMPPKGGCRNCTQKEVYAAVYYMLERSGTQFKKQK